MLILLWKVWLFPIRYSACHVGSCHQVDCCVNSGGDSIPQAVILQVFAPLGKVFGIYRLPYSLMLVDLMN